MSYGTAHRAARRLMGSRPRPMFKLQFARLEAPASSPSWRHEHAAASAEDPDPFGGSAGACVPLPAPASAAHLALGFIYVRAGDL
eukprot:SAG11_NODE_1423_length_4950_cov_6.926201_2_plen_85_part_00